ncbi:uncharacterized protein LOC142635690 [Castanea sativa]|uniref:uncharacterized protein LOC142635690 n=1 Tax=Castanea sativa TaxID=21020 RepID=UPI003F65479C
MPFGLKNAEATYQRLVNKMFSRQISKNMEVYVDDMLVKSKEELAHLDDLKKTFATFREYQMKLNPNKCVFGVALGKFMGFMVSQRGIEANLEKVQVILNMTSPKIVKEVQKLTRRIAALNIFVSKATDRLSTTVVSASLIREEGKMQLPVYYVSQAFQGVEAKYPKIEKFAFALIVASRKLRPQIKEDYEAKEERMQKYLKLMKHLIQEFNKVEFVQIPQSQNVLADEVAKMASSEEGAASTDLMLETQKRPSIEEIHTFAIQSVDARELIKRCDKCQRFRNVQRLPAEKLTTISSPWPFAQWGIEIVGPLPQGKGQANGQTKVTNRTLLRIIKAKLDDAKGAWPEELPNVL